MTAELLERPTDAMLQEDQSTEESETSEASPIIAVEVDEDGDVRLEDHEDSKQQRQAELQTDQEGTMEITSDSDFSEISRHIWIVTTAALPWRTGTAVNPLLRALFLTKEGRPVTLMIPWLDSKSSRLGLYGKEHIFNNPDDQEAWIRKYCIERCNCTEEEVSKLQIRFWEGAYNETFGSIFPIVDICATIPQEEADICILEEPEHLNWFRVPANHSDLGWANKFRHVVGILHTNYADYVRQYGLGFSAPALTSLSSLVVRAYCHRVIRLSATLPHLDPTKEVTCNVHGVRPEFLEPPAIVDESNETTNEDRTTYAPVYFIGKLIWAKGFERVLELQEKYKAETKEYFRMDVYGAGKDQKEIQKAFFGRRKAHKNDTAANVSMSDESNNKKAAAVFEQPVSLRDQITQENPDKVQEDVMSVSESTNNEEDTAALAESAAVSFDDEKKMCDGFFSDQAGCTQSEVGVPLEILGDISDKTYLTSIETAGAALRLIDSVISVGFTADDGPKRSRGQALLSMAPAKTRFKWRRRSLPARFLGVHDHILLRDIPEHKVFLNMSTSEVLCTTSAEALAMGKFVVLPKHPSNEFFLQFPNCLAYETIDQCVLKLQYALENTPEPMADKFLYALSWEGATERFIKAASISVIEVDKRNREGLHEADVKAAQFHVDTAKKSSYFGDFLRSNILNNMKQT